MSAHDDLDRIARLSRRLKEVCEEGEQIRAKIQRIAEHRSFWPERRTLAEGLEKSDCKPSEFVSSPPSPDSDQN